MITPTDIANAESELDNEDIPTLPATPKWPSAEELFEADVANDYPLRQLLKELLSEDRLYVAINYANEIIFAHVTIEDFCRQFGVEYLRVTNLPEQGVLDRPFQPYYEMWLIDDDSIESEVQHSHLELPASKRQGVIE